MMPQQLWETTMNPALSNELRLKMQPEADRIFTVLMGDRVLAANSLKPTALAST